MEEIKIGEYTRNEDGYIEKIDSCDRLTNIYKDEDGKLRKWEGEDAFGNEYSSLIVKHSKNIIDLIEVEDIVKVKEHDWIRVFNIDDKITLKSLIEDCEENNWTLMSIVTHEQFSSLEYRLEE